MLLPEVRAGRAGAKCNLQLQFEFDVEGGTRSPSALVKMFAPSAPDPTSSSQKPIHLRCARALESRARELLSAAGFQCDVRVEWNARLKSCAGRADFRQKLISLNPRLHEHPDEIERTFLHELAHFLAQFRAGRKRILPHGAEWRKACRDLGIGDE